MNSTFQLIRSATVKLRLGGFTLLVDPYLAARGAGRSYAGKQVSPLVELPFDLETVLADVDAVFVSHLHSDHFDDAARERLPRDMPLLCPQSIQTALRDHGFTDVTGIVHEYARPGLQLVITPGRHGPDSVLEEMGPVNGFVAAVPGVQPLYWVGDSIWCPEVEAVVRRYRPGTVVAHACGADWDGLGPLVMDAAMVESLLRAATGSRVIATHMDCVDHATVSRADLRAHFNALPQLRERLVVPADGEVLAI